MFLVLIYKKRERAGFFWGYLLFPIAGFLYTLLRSPRDTLELLGQIYINKTCVHSSNGLNTYLML